MTGRCLDRYRAATRILVCSSRSRVKGAGHPCVQKMRCPLAAA